MEGGKMHSTDNPTGLKGVCFIEYASSRPDLLTALWKSMGFTYFGPHSKKAVDLFFQKQCYFILNREKNTFAEDFSKKHGPCVCALGFRVKSAQQAFSYAVSKGATPVEQDSHSHSFPAIYGVGGLVIYLVDQDITSFFSKESDFSSSHSVELLSVDHLTHNVFQGELQKQCDFYYEVFNFTQRRYFDIKGLKTGLISKVMRSPCNTITIPINEPYRGSAGKQSQIQEFLEEYKGSGVQHIALITDNIVESVKKLFSNGISFLDIPDTYYEELPQRVPNIKENLSQIKENQILADGDEKGYLLQIFTKNVIGPIFYEVIQRHNHDGFGEGNFQALFSAMERDQMERGYLKE